MPDLLLGPLLRYAGETDATLWVETDDACTVSVLGHECRTFEVAGHHYALVVVDDLEPGRTYEYDVTLDGEKVWPEPDSPFPPSIIRTITADHPLQILFGSCRVTLPHVPPYTHSPDDDSDRGREHDALYAVAQRMLREPREQWPDKIVMLGDQVYADEGSPVTRARIRSRRDTTRPPGQEVADFEEYTWLYGEAWGDPVIRWLLSTVGSAMIWDDHDVIDDWNTSADWLREIRRQPWWEERILGAIVSYWIYQHLGNLAPAELHEDEMWDRVRAHEGDAHGMLRQFAYKADRETEGTRWSYCRDWAGVRLVMIDSRGGRVLEGTRKMVDDDEFEWITEHLTGGHRHLIVGTSLPLLMLPGLHHLETWNEAVCNGAWGGPGKKLAEKTRRAVDLEHWPAFGDSFNRLVRHIEEVASGKHGEPPETIVVIAGDVHHAYIAGMDFTSGQASSRAYQAVCSPFRNALNRNEKGTLRFTHSRAGRLIGKALARSARVDAPGLSWDIDGGPWFDNQVGSLRYDGDKVTIAIEQVMRDPHEARLRLAAERRL
jgi:PhoD-like phosphatase